MAEILDNTNQYCFRSGGACKLVAASYLHNEARVGTTENNAPEGGLVNETCSYYLTSGPGIKLLFAFRMA